MPQSFDLNREDCVIRCEGLTRRYGDVTVIDALDLCARAGEFLALLGRSGSGKTTILRLLAGFDQPDEGRIEIAGQCVAGGGAFVPPEQRRVGMVFQEYALFPHLTVAENIGYGLKRGTGRDARVREVLEMVGMAGLGERMPGELSGGQQQRVALARALAPQPAVVLLDEPFSNLDAGLRARLRLELREILQEARATAVFVTHDQEEALSLADRVAVLQDGQIAQVAPPEVLYRLPATRAVAEFVGEANFVPGYAEGDTASCDVGRLPLPLCRPAHGEVDVLLRPEWVRVHAHPEGEAVVKQRLYFGHDQLIRLELPNGERMDVRLGPDDGLRPGDRVRLSIEGPVVAYPREDQNSRAYRTPARPAESDPAAGEATRPRQMPVSADR